MKYTRIVSIGVIVVSLLPPEYWTAEKNGSAISSNDSHHRAEDTPKLYKFFGTPILFDHIKDVSFLQHYFHNRTYNWGVLGFGASDFLSYAAHFCKYDAEDGAIEVVSVGSGDGTIEMDICEMHEKLFGTTLNITLVDNDPKFVNVHYRTVNDLIENRPDIVGNCALLLIWPENEYKKNEYDIEAVRKLQPRALLTLYESYTGFSGSLDFRKWLRSRTRREYNDEHKDTKLPKLKKYKLEEMVHQPVVYKNPRNGTTQDVGPTQLLLRLSIMRLKRKGLKPIQICRSNVTSSRKS